MTKVIFKAAAGLALALISAQGAFAESNGRWVDISNESHNTIYSVHITSVSDDSWGRDLLGSRMVGGFRTVRIEPDNSWQDCYFDVKITYDTGYEITTDGVDLCEVTDLLVDEYDIFSY